MPVLALPKVKIVIASGRGHVIVNDVKIEGVCEAQFAVKAQNIAQVTLVIHGDIELEADQAEIVTRYLRQPEKDDFVLTESDTVA